MKLFHGLTLFHLGHNEPSPLRRVFDSYLNNGTMTLILSDVFGNLSIEYLVENSF